MRALFLTHGFPRWPGDAPGSFILRLGQALGDEGVTVRVVAPAAPGLPMDDRVGGIGVRRFRYAPAAWETLAYTGTMAEQAASGLRGGAALVGLLAAGAAAVARAARDFAPDVVHAHWWFPSGLAAVAAGPLLGAPLVTTVHGTDARVAHRAAALRGAARAVFRRSAAVTAVSSWLAAQVRGIAPDVAPLVAPMPVAAGRFTPGAGERDRRLLFVGRLNAQKGVLDAVRAVAMLPPDVSLDVVGEGPARRDCVALAEQLGVAARVRLHGAVAHDALPALYRAACALVMPSREEGLGLVAVEASLCETPVVAYDSGGVGDVIRQGDTGLLAPTGDTAALAAALARLVADPTLRRALAARARQAALAGFTPAAAARRYAAVYRSVLAGGAPAPRTGAGRAA